MPVHDWTRVPAGTFHDFHSAWIIHLKEALNGGVLPDNYYAMAEQYLGRDAIADVLTLQANGSATNGGPATPAGRGPVAVAEAPPKVSRKVVATENAAYRMARKTLAVRTSSNHRIVALIEIVSPANKDRVSSVSEFSDKAQSALKQGIHVLMVDLLPPGPFDPHGMHAVIWEAYGSDSEDQAPPAEKTLTLASYVARSLPEAYLESVAVGDEIPEMPLFLEVNGYVNVPLEGTYQAAFRGLPGYWRGVLEGHEPPAGR
jgi:hypothetical protein